MTAQIGILNKKAVVLATDSAVTIQGNESGKKIYNSVNKLFAFSKTKPIAVMVYGNAELLGAPWETIIKVYRKQFNKDCKTLDEYAEDFIKWLEKNAKKLFSPKIQKVYFKNSVGGYYLFSIISPIKNEMKKILDRDGKIDKKNLLQFTEEKIEQEHTLLKSKKFANKFTQQQTDNILAKNKRTIDEIINHFFSGSSLSKPVRNKLAEIACYLFTKDIFSNDYSGVVIAGFGDDELYPALVEFQIEGVFENVIKYKKEAVKEITSDGITARIVPFAQADVIHNFLRGIHPANIVYFEKILRDYPSTIDHYLKPLSGTQRKTIKKKIATKNNEIFTKFMEVVSEQFSAPIIHMIGLMPITEMCEFAESLINLTSLRKRVTMQDETVGGETEVVSVTKGEGLIWIKRKHYFDPKLNPGFINNYLNS